MRTPLLVALSATLIVFGCSGEDPVRSDATPPGAVSDLHAGTPTASSVRLSWTAPGDDGQTGTAQSYDIRFAESDLSEANWAAAARCASAPTPQVGGSGQECTVSGLAQSRDYAFALKTADEAGNWSSLSTIAHARTNALDSMAPGRTEDLAERP